MNPQGIANKPEQNLSIESGGTLTAVGWTSRHKIFSPPVEAELFFLTSLFIELTEDATEMEPRKTCGRTTGQKNRTQRLAQ